MNGHGVGPAGPRWVESVEGSWRIRGGTRDRAGTTRKAGWRGPILKRKKEWKRARMQGYFTSAHIHYLSPFVIVSMLKSKCIFPLRFSFHSLLLSFLSVSELWILVSVRSFNSFFLVFAFNTISWFLQFVFFFQIRSYVGSHNRSIDPVRMSI